jgi:hypothetical protein
MAGVLTVISVPRAKVDPRAGKVGVNRYYFAAYPAWGEL